MNLVAAFVVQARNAIGNCINWIAPSPRPMQVPVTKSGRIPSRSSSRADGQECPSYESSYPVAWALLPERERSCNFLLRFGLVLATGSPILPRSRENDRCLRPGPRFCCGLGPAEIQTRDQLECGESFGWRAMLRRSQIPDDCL